ncbi:hypothetical protein GGF32_003525 [Allomyces javanicus]|nr:hypothetical protein GGF32_003525 [Allomyces javanicus]
MSSTRAAGSRAHDDSDNDSLPPLIDVNDDDAGHASDADSLPPLVGADHRSDGSAGSGADYDDDDDDDEPELEPWCTCGECYVGDDHDEYSDEYTDEEDDEDYTDEDEDEDEHDCLCDHHYEQVTGRQHNGSRSASNGNGASSSDRPSPSGSGSGSSPRSAPATSDPSYPSTPMTLGVKFLRPQGPEEVFDLTLPGNVTITALRASVAEKAKIEPALARLIFRGRVLQDGKAAHEYGLEDNMTLHLVTRPPPERAASGSSNGNAPNSLNSRTATASAATSAGRTSSSNGNGASNGTANNGSARFNGSTAQSRPANGSTAQSRTNRLAANGRASRNPATTTQFAAMPGGGVTAQVTMAINEDDDREFTPERFFDRLMSVMQGGAPHDMSRGSGSSSSRRSGASGGSRRSGTARSRGGTSSSNARPSQSTAARSGTGASSSSSTQNQRASGSTSPLQVPHVKYTPLLAWPAAHYRAHLKRHLDPVPQTPLFRHFRAAADAGTLDAILDRALGTARHSTAAATTTPPSPPVRTPRATSTSAFAPTPGVPTLAAARDLLRAMARLETVAATAPGFLDHAQVAHPAEIRHDFAALVDAEVDASKFDDALAHVPAASVWRHVQDLLARHEALTARVGKQAREWQTAKGASVADAQRRAVVAGFVAAATARAYEAAARVLAGATVQPVVGVENAVMVLPGDVDAAELEVGKRGGAQASGVSAGAAASLAAGAAGAAGSSARRR